MINQNKKNAINKLSNLIQKLNKKNEDSKKITQFYIEQTIDDCFEDLIKEIMVRIELQKSKI